MHSFNQGIAYLHQLGITSEGISVGHLDTGVDGAHPAFSGRIAAFRKFGYRGISSQSEPIIDSGFHGTHTAGLIVGQNVEGSFIGIAPAAKLYSGAVIEEGNIIARILSGLDWLLDCEVQIVSLSLGIFAKTPVFHSLIREMYHRNILTVCPIGNRGAGKASAPGYYPEVLSVGALNESGRVATYSGSFHHLNNEVCHKPDLVAPGHQILSAVPRGKVEAKTGTSMAAAQVAGLGALLKSAFPNASNNLIKKALLKSCDPLPEEQLHRAAHGTVNPQRAFELLKNDNLKADGQVFNDFTDPDLPKFIDPRLEDQFKHLTPHSLCEVIFEFESRKDLLYFKQFIDATLPQSNNKYLLNSPIVICQIPIEIVKEVVSWSSVRIASACDIDHFK